MTEADQAYITNQLAQLAPLPLTEENYPYGFDLKISGLGKPTNYLRITPEQFKKIEQVLLGS